ncbi:ribosomal-processing cysteine protease Prp [Tumebacillus sp. ITR2]|uniref:Ribosomal processing cysteine protease Prp n=1 Tax=Tumebacillus amylolyticus TaxID=2801339 RepID=A0ABS1J9U2_9BACL|nr:ribosomal-processing cysteine protease Prp [Tumebacillus amylolyticus]MBL0387046.1 ribosomal-processing cysteine protease Prp [Tumebacillus amylolyticus]
MIRSIIWRDKQGRVGRFSLQGHADAAEYGQDIVCAAVSMLVINTVNSAEQLLGVVLATDDTTAPGDVKCSIPVLADQTADDKLQLLLEAMVLGLHSVRDEYPDFVKVNMKNL